MSKRYSGKSFKDASVMKKAKFSFHRKHPKHTYMSSFLNNDATQFRSYERKKMCFCIMMNSSNFRTMCNLLSIQ